MEWKWNYGQSVLVLPASVLSADATPEQLRVLLWLASDASLAGKPAQLAKLADTDKASVAEILDYWKALGVLTADGDGESTNRRSPEKPAEKTVKKPQPEDAKKPLLRADELPVYNAAELANMMERRASLRILLDACQNIFGKMFNPHEINILFGMVDYLKLDEEYILILLAHCKRLEIKSFRQVERYAISLIDKGITSPGELEACLQEMEAAHQLEGKIRQMFGLKSRALTAKEKNAIEKWASYGYGEEIIRMAFETTVNATGNASIPYANSILERWHSEGLKTAEEIERRREAERQEKEGKSTLGTSFQVNDFFEAALQKSFRNNQDPQ